MFQLLIDCILTQLFNALNSFSFKYGNGEGKRDLNVKDVIRNHFFNKTNFGFLCFYITSNFFLLYSLIAFSAVEGKKGDPC